MYGAATVCVMLNVVMTFTCRTSTLLLTGEPKTLRDSYFEGEQENERG